MVNNANQLYRLNRFTFELISIREFCFTGEWGIPERRLHNMVMWYVISGGFTVFLPDGPKHVGEEELFLVPQRTPHATQATQYGVLKNQTKNNVNTFKEASEKVRQKTRGVLSPKISFEGPQATSPRATQKGPGDVSKKETGKGYPKTSQYVSREVLADASPKAPNPDAREELRFWTVHFYAYDWLRVPLSSYVNGYVFSCPFPAYWTYTLNQMALYSLHSNPPGSPRDDRATFSGPLLFSRMLFDLFRTLLGAGLTLRDAGKDALSPRVKAVLGMIQREYTTSPTIDELAFRVGLSSAGLRNIFKKELNTTPGKYMFDYRMEQACRVLQRTRKSANQIARECGFYDRNHFHQQFKRRFGLSPAMYRKKTLEEGP